MGRIGGGFRATLTGRPDFYKLLDVLIPRSPDPLSTYLIRRGRVGGSAFPQQGETSSGRHFASFVDPCLGTS